MKDLIFTVIIADDEATIRNGLLNAIPWNSYQASVIDAASDGLTAMALIEKYRPSLAVIDIKMPGMDGLEVIRLTREKGIPTRFLILSGYNDFYLAQKAISYGANGYFLKPLKLEEFKDELSRQFSELLSKRSADRASENLESLMETSKIFFLNQLVSNEIHGSEEMSRRISLLNISFHSDELFAVVCTSDAPSSFLPECLRSALPVLSDIFSSFCCEIWIHSDEHIILLFQKTGNTENMHTLLQDSMHVLSEKTGFRFYAGIGKTVTGLDQAAQSYSYALRALSYHLFEVQGDVYDDTIICRQKPEFSPESIDFTVLSEALYKNDNQGINNFCRIFIRSLFFVPYPPPDFIRGMCIYMLNTAGVRFAAAYPDCRTVLSVNAEDTRRLHTVIQLQNWMYSRLCSFSRQYHQEREAVDPIIDAAKKYITQHISSNIKAKDIASSVNLSESYFTIYFKAKTGQTFRDYVLNAKISYSKKLLTERQMTISEIAYATGYQDYRSFSRAFKNVTGVSPSDYQNL